MRGFTFILTLHVTHVELFLTNTTKSRKLAICSFWNTLAFLPIQTRLNF